ncbi:MAG TPA: 2-dehydro-3-deoxygalactonokinase [Woeseiaceae bacterium]|nr:2-dehydro-3-deoxygalactonokinase [Woeseiaceae bacterium]
MSERPHAVPRTAARTSARTSARTILGDWGTSRLRLYLCEADALSGPVRIAAAAGPGIKFTADFAATFRETAARLPLAEGPQDAVLAGMVGANVGWRETGYISCPCDWEAYAAAGTSFDLDRFRITVLPGASSLNEFGYRDIMRGEEVQVLGALAGGDVGPGRRLVCLPGTHTKWVLVADGTIAQFATSMQGELYDLLCRHSVLVARGDAGADAPLSSDAITVDLNAFDDGVQLLRANAALAQAEALFAVRCRQVRGELAPARAPAYLSGILIAADVRDVGARWRDTHAVSAPVLVVGDTNLAALYARALDAFGIANRVLDGEACTLRGLNACRALRSRTTADLHAAR